MEQSAGVRGKGAAGRTTFIAFITFKAIPSMSSKDDQVCNLRSRTLVRFHLCRHFSSFSGCLALASVISGQA